MARLSIRIYLDQSHHGLGPGMAQMLEGVAAHGSIRKSAAAMAMSYRKAWLLIQNMQESFGGAVVTTSIGGSDGGGATLTPLGKTLLGTFRRIEARATRATAADVKMLVAMTKKRTKQKAAKTRAKRKTKAK
jgi:molybdate transport system regulatory protein